MSLVAIKVGGFLYKHLFESCTAAYYLIFTSVFVADKKGIRPEHCDCPDPCEQTVFSTELSYATLSALSADSILGANNLALRKKYNQALSTKSRINVHTLSANMESLQTVVKHFDVSIENLDTKSPKNIKRVLQGLTEIVELSKYDIVTTLGMVLKDVTEAYDDTLKANDELYKEKLLLASKDYLVAMNVLENRKRRNRHGELIVYPEIVLESVNRALSALRVAASLSWKWNPRALEIKDSITRNRIPDSRAKDKVVKEICWNSYQEVPRILAENVNILAEILNVIKGDLEVNSTIIEETVSKGLALNLYSNLSQFIECIDAYPKVLQEALDFVSQSEISLNDALEELRFEEARRFDTFGDKINNLRSQRIFFSDQLKNYSKSGITLLDLAKNIDAKRMDRVSVLLDTAQSILVEEHLSPLKRMVFQIEELLLTTLEHAMEKANKVQNYFEDGIVEEAARMLNIWKDIEFDKTASKAIRFRNKIRYWSRR